MTTPSSDRELGMRKQGYRVGLLTLALAASLCLASCVTATTPSADPSTVRGGSMGHDRPGGSGHAGMGGGI